jgi:hypothetical protein
MQPAGEQVDLGETGTGNSSNPAADAMDAALRQCSITTSGRTPAGRIELT